MAFVVEDGTGLATATSYASRPEADTYHADRTNATWTDASDKTKESALIRATDLIERRYRFRGSLLNDVQRLSWPRSNVFTPQGVLLDDDAVPAKVKDATAEIALAALGGDLDPDGVNLFRSKTEKAGSVSVTETRANTRRVYHKAREILYDLLAPRSLLRS